MSSTQHTAGPWYWHIDHSGRASLRTPDRGNLIVMDFGRMGMQGATPRFAEWPGIFSGTARQRLGGILMDAAHWFSPESGINHPDARLIAAAPDVLSELRAAEEAIVSACGNLVGYGDVCEIVASRLRERLRPIEAAIAKAGGVA